MFLLIEHESTPESIGRNRLVSIWSDTVKTKKINHGGSDWQLLSTKCFYYVFFSLYLLPIDVILNNKLVTFLSVALFAFMITTIALASSNQSKKNAIQECQAELSDSVSWWETILSVRLRILVTGPWYDYVMMSPDEIIESPQINRRNT